MKSVIAAAAVCSAISTAAIAQDFARPTFAGNTEYNFETNAWAGEVGTEVALGAVTVSPMLLGSYANEEFNFNGTEVTVAAPMIKGTEVYLTVGTNDEFKYKDAVAGVSWSF